MIASLPLPVILGLIVTPVFIAIGQVLFKLASRTTGNLDLGGLTALILNPWLLIALVIYGSGTIVWVYVLKSVPLNYAYPFMALTFCLVPLFAWLFLGEAVTWQLAIGTALVLAGLAVITR